MGIVDFVLFVVSECKFVGRFLLIFLWLMDEEFVWMVWVLVIVVKLEIMFVVNVVWELNVVMFEFVLGVFIFRFLVIGGFFVFLELFVDVFFLRFFLNVVYCFELIFFFLVSILLLVVEWVWLLFMFLIIFVLFFEKFFDWIEFFLVVNFFLLDVEEDLWVFNVLLVVWLEVVFKRFEELVLGLRVNCCGVFILFGEVFECLDFFSKFFLELVFVSLFFVLSKELFGWLRVFGLLINL